MTVLAIAHALPTATNEAFQRFRPEEIRTVWNIYRRGQIGQIYYCTDREVAVLLLNCDTIDEARTILAELPMVRERLIDWDYYPIGPFTPWDGLLARLPPIPRNSAFEGYSATEAGRRLA